MKKLFVSMMLAGALLTGGTIYAQNKADGTTGATAQKENVQKCDGCKDKDGKKGDKKKGAKANKSGKGFKGEKGQKFNPFDGVQLTDDQQQRLQVLRQGLGPVVLTPEQQAKIPVNKDLTKEQKKQLKAEKKAKKLENKKKYLNGVKEILTPDQYVIFLENCYLATPNMSKSKGWKPADGARGRGHGDKSKKDKK